MFTALKSLAFLILVPGFVGVYFPLSSLRYGPQVEMGFLSLLAFPLWFAGTAMVLWCFWDFLVKGRGTPAPFDPPKELVVTGLYKYVRNPIYVGVTLALLGNFLWFGYWNLLIYAALALAAFHLVVLFYEEPTLRRKFGAAYEEYLRIVPRWIPRAKSGP